MQITKIKVLELTLAKVHVLFFLSVTEKVWATLDSFISIVSEPVCSCSLKATQCNLASMIYTIKMLSPGTENSFNTQFWLIYLNALYVHLKVAFSVHIPFPKPTCSVTTILLICRWYLIDVHIHLNRSRKTVIRERGL